MSPFELTLPPPSSPSSPCRAAPTFSRATASETYWRSPFGTSATSSIPRALELPDEGCDLARLLGRGAASVEHAGEEELVEALGDRVGLRRVEVDSDPVHGQVGEARVEGALGVAEREPERELRPAGKRFESAAEALEVDLLLAGEKRLLEDDELCVERVELRLQDALGDGVRRQAGAVRERERRRQRYEPRPWKRADVALADRLCERRRGRRCARGAIEGVRVEEARQRAGVEPVGGLDERPEDVLPAQHPVGEEVEAGVLLGRDQLGQVALDLLVDRLLRRAAAVEVARRLHERFGAGIEPWDESLQICLLHDKRPRLKRSGGNGGTHGSPVGPLLLPARGANSLTVPSLSSPDDRQLVLGVLDPLLDLPAVAFGLAALDRLQLGLRRLELLPRPRVVDVSRVNCVVDERERSILLDLEEARPGGELQHLGFALHVHARRARVQHRDQRRVTGEHADLPVRSGNDQHLDLALEDGPVGRDERDVERRHCYAETGSGSASGSAACSSASGSSSPPWSPRAFATACSIVPTM